MGVRGGNCGVGGMISRRPIRTADDVISAMSGAIQIESNSLIIYVGVFAFNSSNPVFCSCNL